MGKLQELIELLDGKASGMTLKPPERSQTMQDEQDYREPWDQAGSTEASSKQGANAKEFHS